MCTVKSPGKCELDLGQVSSLSHSRTVNPRGSRTYLSNRLMFAEIPGADMPLGYTGVILLLLEDKNTHV